MKTNEGNMVSLAGQRALVTGANSGITAGNAQSTTVPSSDPQNVGKSLLWPLEGAGMPRGAANVPGAARNYRNGRSQGFTFSGSDSGVSVKYGLAVRAAAA